MTRGAWCATGGLFLGGLFGFAMRPSVPLLGKLPFAAVITRGTTLTGVDRILVDAAKGSSNLLLAGAAIGALVGWGLAALTTSSPALPTRPADNGKSGVYR